MLCFNKLCYLVFYIILLENYVKSARILGAVFTPSFSHQIAFRPIWRELSLRGHQVTVLTTDPMNDTKLVNLTEIDLSVSYDIMKSFNTDEALSSNEKSVVERVGTYMKALSAVADRQFADSVLQNLIQNKSEQFDLLMIEVIFPTHLALAWRFQAPFIGLISLDAPPRIHAAVGNPIHPALYPEYSLPFTKNLTFMQRLISTLFLWFMLLYGDYRLYPREDLTVKKYFGNDAPTLKEIEQNMSMLFLNTNPIFHNLRPLTPTTIQIGGGLHFNNDNEALPKDIENYLDKAEGGFVYFSLGSNVKSASLKQEVKNIILQALSEIPYQCLWKFEDENVGNLPTNVKLVKWVPQLEVLGHRNIKAFITQGGLQSIEEAIYFKVPMVGIPFYGDQLNNVHILESKGLGIALGHSTMSKDDFRSAVVKVASDSTFKKNIKKTADLFKDEQIHGLEKAVWWAEYVIRHKGAEHLRPSGLDLPLYQYLLLDVVGFLLLLVYLIYKIIATSFKLIIFRCRKIGGKLKTD